MGALVGSRKRGDDYFTLNSKSPDNFDRRIDTHVSKRPRSSPSVPPPQTPERPEVSSVKSSVTRIYQYPEAITKFRREVHAPCRPRKFGFSSNSKDSIGIGSSQFGADLMGNVLGYHYDRAKSTALESLRYFKKDKEVIDVDDETVKDDVSEDSHVEEVEIIKDDRQDDREGQSVVSDERIEEEEEKNSIVAKKLELDGRLDVGPSSSSGLSSLTVGNLKVDRAGKVIDLEVEELGVPIHKKLLDSVERRNDKLSKLRFQIELNQKHLATLQLLRPQKKPEEEDAVIIPKEPFVPLTDEEEREVDTAFSNSNRRRALVTHENSNIVITGEVLQCLRPGAWLNDEVINVYLELLKERERWEPSKFLKCHFFNTFFYKKLIGGRGGYEYNSVRRWTTQRKLGYSLFDCDKIFVPIHKEIHWTLGIINKKEQKFQYLDSLRGSDSKVMKVLARYFVDEVKDKSGKVIDVSSWEREFVEDLPEQENGFDCGVFMIKYADFYSRDIGLCFKQEHMPYFRWRTAKEILRLKAE